MEDRDDAFHEIDELLKSWDDRLTVKNLSLAKRYSDGKLVVGMDCKLRIPSDRPGLRGHKYRIIFQGENSPSVSHEKRWPFCFSGERKPDKKFLVCGPYNNHESVLISDIKLMKAPERVIPSLVWFESLDQEDSLLAGSVYFFEALGFETMTRLADWKIGLVDIAPAVGKRQLAGQMVEGRPEIVDYVADDSAPSKGDILTDRDAVSLLSGVRIVVTDNAIWFAAQEGGNFGLQVLDVLLGPFDLDPHASERISVRAHG